jgi:hypothetical protein
MGAEKEKSMMLNVDLCSVVIGCDVAGSTGPQDCHRVSHMVSHWAPRRRTEREREPFYEDRKKIPLFQKTSYPV